MRAIGTRLYRSVDGTIDTYEQLAGIMDFTLPEMTRGSTDITPLDTQDDSKQYEAGMSDVGDSEFSLLYDSTDPVQAIVVGDYDTGNTVFYKVLYRDGSISLFKGFVTKVGKELPKEESVLLKISIKGAGKVVDSATDTTVS